MISVHFSACFVAKRYLLQQVSEEVNKNKPAGNTMVQLLILHTDHKCTQCTVTDRQTDDIMMP